MDSGREIPRGATRRRILSELCHGSRTANELAETFGVSGTAIRSHLASLQDEGFISHRVERRGPGKPTYVYDLEVEGELLLSNAYPPVLWAVLSRVESTWGAAELESLLRSAGVTLGSREPTPSGSLRQRMIRAVAHLEELGAIVDLVELEDGYSIEGTCCPLASLSPRMPLLCKMVESMLTQATGINIVEHCEREQRPHCRFSSA